MLELPLWLNGMGGILGVLGHRFDPWLAHWVKDLVLPQLWLRSRLCLGSDPWPGSSMCLWAAKNEKKKRKKRNMYWFLPLVPGTEFLKPLAFPEW